MQYVVVFDTNILISALLSSNSKPFRCLTLAKIGQIESVTCQEILDEFAQKLLLKFKFCPIDSTHSICTNNLQRFSAK